jgi:hypothetical protein
VILRLDIQSLPQPELFDSVNTSEPAFCLLDIARGKKADSILKISASYSGFIVK